MFLSQKNQQLEWVKVKVLKFWACRVKPGRILFEVDGVAEEIAREALYKASAKLPIKCKFIKRI